MWAIYVRESIIQVNVTLCVRPLNAQIAQREVSNIEP